ncbi:MAG: hypothetical protein ACYS8Z_03690 [Planctomycetota bacterium]
MSRRFVCILRGLLESRRLPLFLGVLAVVVMLPALGHGWFLDDMLFRTRFLKPAEMGGNVEEVGGLFWSTSRLSDAMSELYSFFKDQEDVKSLMDYGLIPWWTDPECQISFWRPVTSFTMWLDYQLWPNSAPLHHLHSILWFGGAVYVLAVLYRRIGGIAWIAGFAGVLFVLEDNNYFPVAFVANRNSIIALFFGALAVLTHDKWRRDGRVSGAVLSCVFLALSLLSAEAGIATAAYLGAYALAYDEGKLSRRLLSLAPAIGVVVVWRIVHGALGYSTHASGVYIDPGAEPLRFVWAALERGPIILFAQLFGSFADLYYAFSDPARVKVYAVVAGVLVVLLLSLRPLFRADRAARFWFLGMVFAAVPVCATMASNRNLIFVGVGGMGLAAHFVGGMFSGKARPRGHRIWRMPAWTFCGLFLLVHVVFGVIGRAASPWMYSKWTTATEKIYDINLPDDMSQRDVVVINTACPLFLVGLPARMELEGRGIPRSVRILAPAYSPLKVTRVADKVLEVRAVSGNLFFWEQPDHIFLHFIFFLQEFNTIFRDPRNGFEVGDTVEAGRVAIEIKAVDGTGQPVAAEFRFDVSLDDPSLYWVMWQYHLKVHYVPFTVPPVGQSVEIAGVPY